MPLACDEGTRVPLYSGIVADIGDEQEIRQSLSTVSSHLARITAGLARASRGTLFLLDELGGGTDPEQGAALSEALLEHLVVHGVPTLASTHIGRLKEFAFKHTRAENASVEFDPATLAPRYRVLIGTPGESAALVIARRLGLPAALVDRAEERIERRDEELVQLMADVGVARTQAERARGLAEDRLADAAREVRAAEEVRAELERKGELIEVEAQRDLEERVRSARDRLGRLAAFLDQVPAAVRAELERELARLDDDLSGAALGGRRKAFLDGLKKGSWVYLARHRKRCLVQRVDRAKREVVVQLGGLRMSVSFDEVSSYESG
jgi:DNA mismatch repair protein MutS2